MLDRVVMLRPPGLAVGGATIGRRISWLALGLCLGCAPRVPPEYARHRAAAERAYVHGRYDEAANLWLDAASAAKSARDRNEAQYRSAVSLERAGHVEAARHALGRIAESGGERAPRAALDLARLERRAGNDAAANQWLDRLVNDHPESWAANRAVELRIRAEPSPRMVERYLRGHWERLADGALRERVGYELARHLERQGQLERAARQYAAVAERFPYPLGALWDDAMVRGARLESRLGRHRAAIARLEDLLGHRESSTLQGSYERPRYAEARFTIAELYRDELGELARARREYLRLWTEHTTSRLRDDAKWQAAVTAKRAGDTPAACSDVRDLMEEVPESRYVPCSHLLCSEIDATAKRCPDYIAREVVPRAEDSAR